MENPLGRPPLDTPFGESIFSPVWQRWLSRLSQFITKQTSYSESLNPTSINANTVSTQTFTVTGLSTNDIITVNPPALTTGLVLLSWRVSAANTLSLTFWNSTGSPIDESAGTYLIYAVRK